MKDKDQKFTVISNKKIIKRFAAVIDSNNSNPTEQIKESKKKVYLGDVALSYQYIETITKKQKTSFDDYFKKMLVHGLLHLIGYEHNSFKNYKKMSLLEKKIIRNI